jgi:hypothetical protein
MKTNRPGQTVLLFIAMHGELIARDRILTPLTNSMMILNKFSMASPGQCSVSSFSIRQYVLYAMCDAEKTGKPLDILTMFKEARSHIYAKNNNVDGITAFNRPEVSPLKAAHDFSLKKQLENQSGFSREARYDEVLGGDTYRGNEYYDKYYTFDDKGGGIFICSDDWPEIGAFRMDNLLENDVFIDWIRHKYVSRIDLIQNFDKLVKAVDVDVSSEDKGCLSDIYLNDIIEFCVEGGKHLMSMVDDSCSSFDMNSITLEEATILSKTLISQKLIAKGIKSKRKGSKSKRKGSKSKKKRQAILHRFNKSIP